jgi:hypothetical protein
MHAVNMVVRDQHHHSQPGFAFAVENRLSELAHPERQVGSKATGVQELLGSALGALKTASGPAARDHKRATCVSSTRHRTSGSEDRHSPVASELRAASGDDGACRSLVVTTHCRSRQRFGDFTRPQTSKQWGPFWGPLQREKPAAATGRRFSQI